LTLSQFQWTTVVFGMILGLGVTRILSNLIAIFRGRSNAPPDPVPVLWAICIFALQLELWRGFSDLRSIVKEWTFPLFLLFTASPLLLFFAAALILPSHELSVTESHQEIFQSNGRWALIAISVFTLKSMIETAYFWKEPLLTFWAFLGAMLVVLPILSVFSPWRVRRIIAILRLVVTTCYVFADNAIAIRT
jgi:hypothetical protein